MRSRGIQICWRVPLFWRFRALMRLLRDPFWRGHQLQKFASKLMTLWKYRCVLRISISDLVITLTGVDISMRSPMLLMVTQKLGFASGNCTWYGETIVFSLLAQHSWVGLLEASNRVEPAIGSHLYKQMMLHRYTKVLWNTGPLILLEKRYGSNLLGSPFCRQLLTGKLSTVSASHHIGRMWQQSAMVGTCPANESYWTDKRKAKSVQRSLGRLNALWKFLMK